MKTVLVPTDFSPVAYNAAKYAVQMAAQTKSKVILYNLTEEDAAASEIVLTEAKNSLLAIADVNIETVVINGKDLIESLATFINANEVDLVIMGISDASWFEQKFLGSNSLDLVNKNVCPVLIVPPAAQFDGLNKMVLATDFKDVESTVPFKPLLKMLDMFNPELHVLNIDDEHYIEITPEYQAQKAKLEAMIGNHKPNYSFVRFFDFLEGVNTYVESQDIKVIITIPHKHSFFGSMFGSHHTKELVYHTNVPVLAIHE